MKGLPYVDHWRDRHGRTRYYFRRHGRRTALTGKPGSVEFAASYSAALAGLVVKPPSKSSPPGSLSAAIAAYYVDNGFTALAPTTRQARREILERLREQHGTKRLAQLEEKHIVALMGTKKPFAARNWLKAIKSLMQFTKRAGLRVDDPTENLKPAKAKAGTIHTWTEDEIEQFEQHHAVGTRARLALGLLLYTAARRGDVVRLGPQHVRLGRLYYSQQKTRADLSIPVHPALAEILNYTPSSHLTFLVTPAGTPYTPKGFGKLFRRWCDEAGLPQCSAHGLRKAQARRLAEAGCSAHQIASITGHKTLSEVQRYADAANRAHLADEAIARTSIAKPPLR